MPETAPTPDLDRLRASMAGAGFAALLLTSPAARAHVLPTGAPSVVLTAGGEVASGTSALQAVDGPIGFEDDLSWDLFDRLSNAGKTLRPAADLVFAELAAYAAGEREAVEAAAELATVGYTAVMDHLHVGMDVREIAANVDRSLRRAGGLLGWLPADATAGSDLVTVRGHDPATAKLTAESPVRYSLHPLSAGAQGYAAATAVLRKAGPALRDAGESCSAATEALIAAVRTGEPLRDGYAAAAQELGDRTATTRILALRGGGALALSTASAVTAQPGMVLGVRSEVAVPGGGAVELAGTVVVSDTGPELLTKTPLRLVELY